MDGVIYARQFSVLSGGLIQAAVGFVGGLGGFLTKRSGFFLESAIEDDLSGGVNGVGLVVMNLVWGHEADAGMG